MKTEEIKAITEQFAERLRVYNQNDTNFNLSEMDKKILFEIGLPVYKGYGGTYIPVEKLELENGEYLKIYTRQGEEDTYSRYINTSSGKVVFKNTIGGNKDYFFINTDLESFLKYLQVYEDFRLNIKIPEN